MSLSVSANKFNEVKKDLNNLNIKTRCTSMDYLKKKVQSLVKKTLKEQEKNKKMSGGYSPFIYQVGGCNCNRTPKSEISGGCGCNYDKYMSGGMLGATVLPQRYFNPKMEGGSHGNGDYHITSYVDNTSIARAGIPSNFSGGKSHKLRIKKYNILTSSKMTEADIKVANKMSNTILSYVVNYLKVHKKLLHKEKPLLLTQKIVKHIFDDMNKDRNFKL